MFFFCFTVINIKEETLGEKNKKEVTIPQIIENKTNPYVLMQVRYDADSVTVIDI